MLEQLSNDLPFTAFFVASKVGKAGLTVTVDVKRQGTTVVTGASATDHGGGFYSYTLPAAYVILEGHYLAIFKTTDATVDQQHIPSLWLVNKAGLEHLGASVQIQISNPIAADGTVSVVRGDDYNAADGRKLVWTDNGNVWPDLTGASIKVTVRDLNDQQLVQLTGAVDVATGSPKKVSAQPTATDLAIAVGHHKYDVEATISTRKVTLLRGTWRVFEDQTRT